jgi:exonuclease SbcD
MREVRGKYSEVANKENYQNTNTDDYVRIILTDEEDEPDACMKLRNIYPQLMNIVYDNKRTQTDSAIEVAVDLDKTSPLEFFGELYEMQNGQPMSDCQAEYARQLLAELQQEEHA